MAKGEANERWLSELASVIDNTPLTYILPLQVTRQEEQAEPDEQSEPDEQEWESREKLPIHSAYGAEKLIDAVLVVMARDYILSAKRLLKKTDDEIALFNVRQTEAFIRSDVFQRLTMSEIEPDTLIERLRKAVVTPGFRPGSILLGAKLHQRLSQEDLKERQKTNYERWKEGRNLEQRAAESGGKGLNAATNRAKANADGLNKAYNQGFEQGWNESSRVTVQMVCAGVCFALRELYGFGPERIHRVLTRVNQELLPNEHCSSMELAQAVYDETGIELDFGNPFHSVLLHRRRFKTGKKVKSNVVSH